MPATPATSASFRAKPLRLGFVALTDAAPFAVAKEHGLFAQHGIDVVLSREVGWATIREKIIYGELDAAQAPAPMLWSTRLGLDSVPFPVLTALVLNLHGNAITLSERLWQAGIHDQASLRDEARRRSGERKLTLGVVFLYSSHHLMLRSWLRSAGLNPDRDVRIVVVPPAQMFRNLSAGTIDGYCAGEPWNTLAVREKAGWCPTWSAEHQPKFVEKVLMVTERFATQRPLEHAALIASLIDACAWCDVPQNRPELAQILAGPAYINQSAKVIAPTLLGQLECGHERIVTIPDFHVFHNDSANVPSLEKASSIQSELLKSGLLPVKSADSHLCNQLFREDIFRQSIHQTKHELIIN